MATPSISVIIASGAGGEFLFRCLQSLSAQARATGTLIIVVDRVGEPTRNRIRRQHPEVCVVAVDADDRPTIPQMRRRGVELARTDVVAIIEEHCTVPDGWLGAIQAHFGPGVVAIGGPILDSQFQSVRDWCVYFSEYHNYLPPWEDAPRYALNGANIAYDRSKLEKYMHVLDAGYWEVVLHPHLAHDGAFRAVGAMGAAHTGPFSYRYYLRQRYLLSRAWGGTQRELVSTTRRLAHLLAGPVFPVFLFMRVTLRVLAKRSYLQPYLRALPLLIPAWCAYAFGEWLGYLVGPGRSLEEVE